VRCLAILLGTCDQDVLPCFVLVIALLLDPSAALLLLSLVVTNAKEAQ
jgi:hypothetical protein